MARRTCFRSTCTFLTAALAVVLSGACAGSDSDDSSTGAGGTPGGGATSSGGESAASGASGTVVCAPDSIRPCVGDGDCAGVETCESDGSGWGACDCSPVGSGGTGGGIEPAGGTGGGIIVIGGTGGIEPIGGTGGVIIIGGTGGVEPIGGTGGVIIIGGTGGIIGTGGVTGTGGTVGDNWCETSSDCDWGEIDHEILSQTDCPCLFGCPNLPQNVTTVQRRIAQYQALCDPRVDGNGDPCPIDECLQPPPLECIDGICRAEPTGAGGSD